MKIAQRIAETLRTTQREQKCSTADLVRRTGLTAVSIRAALTGVKDSKLSTIIAIAHELELDLVLVPKSVSASIAPQATPAPQVKTLADAVREQVHATDSTNAVVDVAQPGEGNRHIQLHGGKE